MTLGFPVAKECLIHYQCITCTNPQFKIPKHATALASKDAYKKFLAIYPKTSTPKPLKNSKPKKKMTHAKRVKSDLYLYDTKKTVKSSNLNFKNKSIFKTIPKNYDRSNFDFKKHRKKMRNADCKVYPNRKRS